MPPVHIDTGMPNSFQQLLDWSQDLRSDIARALQSAEELGLPQEECDELWRIYRSIGEMRETMFEVQIPVSARLKGIFYADPRLEQKSREMSEDEIRGLVSHIEEVGCAVAEDVLKMRDEFPTLGLVRTESAHKTGLKARLFAKHMDIVLEEYRF